MGAIDSQFPDLSISKLPSDSRKSTVTDGFSNQSSSYMPLAMPFQKSEKMSVDYMSGMQVGCKFGIWENANPLINPTIQEFCRRHFPVSV